MRDLDSWISFERKIVKFINVFWIMFRGFRPVDFGIEPVDPMDILVAVHMHLNPSTTNVDAKEAVHRLSLAQKIKYWAVWKQTVQTLLAAPMNAERKRLNNLAKGRASEMAAGVAPRIEENERVCRHALRMFGQ